MLVSDRHYLYRRKPAGLPATFGKQYSFVDALVESKEEVLGLQPELPAIVEQQIMTYGYQQEDRAERRDELLERFTREQEYGLLNRLDTPTQGWLYFAKDNAVYVRYYGLQKTQDLHKQYIACVAGDINRVFKKDYPGVTTEKNDRFAIDLPIMHHVELDERMVVLKDWDSEKKSSSLLSKGRGDLHERTTSCEVLSRSEEESWLLVTIKTGIRHQIRAHLGAIGYPIVGEPIYGKSGSSENLRLWSVGLVVSD